MEKFEYMTNVLLEIFLCKLLDSEANIGYNNDTINIGNDKYKSPSSFYDYFEKRLKARQELAGNSAYLSN